MDENMDKVASDTDKASVTKTASKADKATDRSRLTVSTADKA